MIPIIVASTIASKKRNYDRYNYEEDKKCAKKCTSIIFISFICILIIAAFI